MTDERRKQIEDAAAKYEPQDNDGIRYDFVAGAEWADANPSNYVIQNHVYEKIKSLESRIEKLRDALKFYAEAEYGGGVWAKGSNDIVTNEIASKALEEDGE